jgi:hypothetical protein
MNETPWISVSDQPPPPDTTVETKIDDKDGCRNVTRLMLIGRMWYVPDGSMYVYYTPTHWRPLL